MRVVVVPSTLALLPAYTSIEDPVADLRRAVGSAVDWLVRDGAVQGLAASPSGLRVARHLVGVPTDPRPGVLVAANGSAMRTEKAPGHFDDRAAGYDAVVGDALRAGDTDALAGLDHDLASELWAGDDALALIALGRSLRGTSVVEQVQVDYDDAPFGVQYWVVRWELREVG